MNSSFLHTKTTGIPPLVLGGIWKRFCWSKIIRWIQFPALKLPWNLFSFGLHACSLTKIALKERIQNIPNLRWFDDCPVASRRWTLGTFQVMKRTRFLFLKVLVAVKKTLQFKHVKYPYKKNGIRAMMCHVFCRFQSFEDLTSESITSAPFPRCIERSSAS